MNAVLNEMTKHRVVVSPFGGEPPESAPTRPSVDTPFGLSRDDVVSVEADLAGALSWLHSNRIAGVRLTEESVVMGTVRTGYGWPVRETEETMFELWLSICEKRSPIEQGSRGLEASVISSNSL